MAQSGQSRGGRTEATIYTFPALSASEVVIVRDSAAGRMGTLGAPYRLVRYGLAGQSVLLAQMTRDQLTELHEYIGIELSRRQLEE